MAATKKELGQDPLSGDELMDALEDVRATFPGGVRPERNKGQKTIESIAAQKRRSHLGGDGNHRFEGERYLNIRDNKEARRFQLRKLIDEGGQDSVGGPVPSHPRRSSGPADSSASPIAATTAKTASPRRSQPGDLPSCVWPLRNIGPA